VDRISTVLKNGKYAQFCSISLPKNREIIK